VDFTSGYQSGTWSDLWEDFYCDWRACWFNQRIEPPIWTIGDEVIATGGKGILFRSRLSPDGVNLVFYVDELGPNDQFAVCDPQATLPRNQSSRKQTPNAAQARPVPFCCDQQ
jgi:hypothetical protein